jgi:putative RecB family exonuclease
VHCPEGQAQGPEKSDWAGLEPYAPTDRRDP